MDPTITSASLNALEQQALYHVWVALIMGLGHFLALGICVSVAFRKNVIALWLLLIYGFSVFMIDNQFGVIMGSLIMVFALTGLFYGRMLKKRELAARQSPDGFA